MLDPANLTGDSPQSPPALPLPPVASSSTVALNADQANNDSESRALAMAAVVDLMSTLDFANSLEEAADQVGRTLATHLSAHRVFVLSRKDNQKPLTVIADTASDDGETNNPLIDRLATAAGEEIAVRNRLTSWPTEIAGQRHALMAVAQLARGLGDASIEAISLAGAADTSGGVLIVVGSTDPTTANFLRMIAEPLSSRLGAVERLAPTKVESALRNIVSLTRSERRKVGLAAVIAIAILMAVPLRYTVRADLQLQPVEHRFIAVPFDGPLQAAHVRPGDTVRQGDLLASINPREIEYELSGIRAELNRAVQEKKGMMAEHDSAGSKSAALESERLRLKSELLQYQRGNLEIRSPIDGVVVSGDLKQSEGMPLDRGDTLFEIAPLGQMVVELAIAEDDFSHVRPGMRAEFYVHALPGRRMSGTLDRIHPRAELRDHENVFIAEIRIDDPDNVLRPGMNGRAKIVSDRHPLAWNLFHKSYYALRRAVGR